MQHAVYQTKVKDLDDLKRCMIDVGSTGLLYSTALSTTPSTSGINLSAPLSQRWTLQTFALTLASVRLCEINITFLHFNSIFAPELANNKHNGFTGWCSNV